SAKHAEWMRKAERSLDKQDDALARAAIERAESYRRMREPLQQQVADQRTQTESLRSALRKLEQKLAEAREKAELLIAQQRRSRVALRATEAGVAIRSEENGATF